ncbi:MAG: EamA family transporter, partial [Deltaproteobacteria bacterium]|nr:EamA family transporter [Deltaproteobacteria bacterium]
LAFINSAYLAAISKIPVAAAIFIQYLAPVVIALFAWRFMGERMTRLKLAALGLAIGGCFLVAGAYDLELLSLNRTGLLWALVTIFGFSGYCLLSEYGLRTYGPWTVLGYALLFAGAFWSAALGPEQLLHLGHDALSWLLVAYSVTLGTVIPFGLFFYGIQHLRATRATIISTFEPIAAGLIALAFLGETLEVLQVAGGLAVVGAVVIIQKEREQDQLAPVHVRDRQTSG